MKRIHFNTVFIIISCLVLWILWSSHNEVNNTILILKKANYFIRDLSLRPTNTICKENPFLTIIVTSYVGHIELRSAHRRAMPSNLLRTLNATRIFLLARIPPSDKYITQEAINDESTTFGDILQGSFMENYRNLTHKHLMGLQWASAACKGSYILKVDDDTVFSLNSTVKMLQQIKISNSNSLLMGYMLNNTKPRRSKQNKWYVTWEEYSRNYYPPYLSGWYYLITPDLAAQICDEAVHHQFFWIDDIFVTGILVESLDIQLKQLPNYFWLEYYELLECCLSDMVKKFIRCDYVVGPNGGRNNLILEFNEALGKCRIWSNCTMRSIDKPLKQTCVVNKERDIYSDGKAEVQFVKL